LIISHS